MLSHYISDRPTCSTDTQLPSITQTLRYAQTHHQMYTATDTVQCSRPDKLELLNARLTTNEVSDCLFDSIPYNKLCD